MGHGRTLLALPDHETMIKTAEHAIKQSLSVRALEAKVKELLAVMASGELQSTPTSGPGKKKPRPVWLNELDESLVEALSTPVAIKYGRKRSQIVIDCGSQAELDRIFTRLKNA